MFTFRIAEAGTSSRSPSIPSVTIERPSVPSAAGETNFVISGKTSLAGTGSWWNKSSSSFTASALLSASAESSSGSALTVTCVACALIFNLSFSDS